MEIFILPVVLSALLSFTPRVRYAAQTLTTITHELGHAVVVFPFGGRLHGIKLRLTTEGEAQVGIPRYPFPIYHLIRILNLFAGYSAPVYLSFFLILCSVERWVVAAEVVLCGMSLLVLLFIRNWFGVLVALSFVALNIAMAVPFHAYYSGFVLTMAFILLIRGVMDIFNAGKWTFGRQLDSSDFTLASDELFGPPQLWYVLFCVFHVPAMLFTALMVWGEIQHMMLMK